MLAKDFELVWVYYTKSLCLPVLHNYLTQKEIGVFERLAEFT
jgi:hypothetical protein